MSAGNASHELVDAVVHSMALAGDRVLLIELRAPTGELPGWQAGSHIDLHLSDSRGTPLIRQYSLLGSDADASRYLVAVLRERAGRGGSAAVHDRLRVGDRLRISAPRNTFPLAAAARSLLVAGGIGITPMLAMADRLERDGADYELHAYSASMATMPLLEHAAGRPYAGRLVTHLSSTGDSMRAGAPPYLGAPGPGDALYVCGPPAFIDAVVGSAAAAGWPEESVHVERFELAEPLELTGDAFAVVAASTGLRMPVAEDETIAEVLQRHGFEVFLSCEQGICGSCITGVLDGIPEHRDEVQSAAEHAANTQINICCSRSRTPTLVLDI